MTASQEEDSQNWIDWHLDLGLLSLWNCNKLQADCLLSEPPGKPKYTLSHPIYSILL